MEIDEGKSPEPVTILIVDDNPRNILALSAILDRPDYRIVTADSGRAALKQLSKGEYALVLLDVKLPEMDGYSVAAALKEREQTRDIPVIFVTAVATQVSDVYRGYSVGAVDYIQKPLEPEIIRAKVAVFVDLFRKQNEIRRQAEIIRNSERAQFLAREHDARLRAERAEKRFRDLVNELSHAIIWEASGDLSRFSFVSERAEDLLSYPIERWTSEPGFFLNHVHPEDRPAVLLRLERLQKVNREGGMGERCEHRMLGADGTYRWFHTGFQDERDANGNLVRLRGLTLDIGSMKDVESALRVSQERLELAMSAANMGLWDWNLATGDLILSNTMKRLVGQPMVNRSPHSIQFRDLVHPEDRERVLDAVRDSVNQGRDFDMQFRVAMPDESMRWIHAIGKTFKSSEGEILGLSGAGVEVTARINADRERERLMSELREAVRIREEMVAIVAHDLKNPLSAVDLSASILMRIAQGEDAKAFRQQAMRIKQANGRALKLTRDILDFAKIESGRFSIEPKSEIAKNIAAEAVELLRPLAVERGVELRLKADDESLTVYCDYERALQIFSNLIGNAIKFTQPKGWVLVETKALGDFVEFVVEDNGPGIQTEDVPNLFTRFWQANRTGTKGIGFGLYIAKRLVETHGGEIWVSTAPGQGSRFSFCLPRSENVFERAVAA